MELGRRAWVFFVAATLATRIVQFGNPVIQVDEQFYLLVGDRLLHGTLPFVDLWDRKPFGLFALYALIRTLGGSGILQYQLVASGFVVLTAAAIGKLSLRLTNGSGAIVTGTVYIVYILSSGGDGGQAPVFYNLLVTVAALLILKIQERDAFDSASIRIACATMLVLGLAIQVKYTVIFEGVFFGVWLLKTARDKHIGLRGLAGLGLAWATIALLPTVAVFLFYWKSGHESAFVYANFLSIFRRSSATLDIPQRLLIIVAHIGVPGAVALWGMTRPSANPAARTFVIAWTGAAIVGFGIFGTYHDHYALPLLCPIAIAGAPIYGDALARLSLRYFHPSIASVVVTIGVLLGIGTMIGHRLSRGTGQGVFAAARIVGQAPPRCIFVFAGDPILYHLTRSCVPTIFAFPSFLSERSDSVSLGVDPMRELRATMAKAPTYVFVRVPVLDEIDPRAWAYMKGEIAKNYRLAIRQPAGNSIILGYRHTPSPNAPPR